MRKDPIKRMTRGILMGAGALWAFGVVHRMQKSRVMRTATAATDKLVRKAGKWLS